MTLIKIFLALFLICSCGTFPDIIPDEKDTVKDGKVSNDFSSSSSTKEFENVVNETQKILRTNHAANDNFGKIVRLTSDHAFISSKYGVNWASYSFSNGVLTEEFDGALSSSYYALDSTLSDNKLVTGYVSSKATIEIFDGSSGSWKSDTKLEDIAVNATGSSEVLAATSDYIVLGIAATTYSSSTAKTSELIIFKKTGSTWAEDARFSAPTDLEAKSGFACTVAISGTHIAVGVCPERTEEEDYADERAVPAYWQIVMYENTGSTWAKSQVIKSTKEVVRMSDLSIALEGSTLIVASDDDLVTAKQADVASDSYSEDKGVIHHYELSSSTWSLQTTITNDISSFAEHVEFSGDYLLTKASTWKDVDGTYRSYAGILVYKKSGTTWTNTKTLVPKDADSWTSLDSFSINGDYVLAGSYNHSYEEPTGDDAQSDYTGAAYLFKIAD